MKERRAVSSLSPSGSLPEVADALEEVGVVGPEVGPHLGLVALHLGDRHVVDVALGAGEDHQHLLLHRHRRVEPLLEQLGEPVAPVELGLGHLVELGAEGGERLELAELGQVELEGARHRLHGLDLGGAPHPADRDAHVDGRTDAGVEEVALEEHLAVGDRDHVGRDVGRHVAGLGLDDGQGGQASPRPRRRTAWPPARAAGCAGRRRRPGRPRGPAAGGAAATSGGRPRPAWTGRRRR